jgi:hypothetical protein
MSWQMSGGDDPKPYWVNDGIGDQNSPPGVGANAPGASAGNTGTTNTGGNTNVANASGFHIDTPIPTWPQYPSGDLAPYNGGYANHADQIRAAFGLPDTLSSSPFYGQGAGRYSYANGTGNGKAYPKNAGRSAPWLGNGTFPSFAPNGGVPAPAGGGLLSSGGNSQPVPSVTVNGKPPTKVGSDGLLSSTPPVTNGGAGGAVNPGYIPGVNLPWGVVPSVGDPMNQYGGPTGRDLGHLWGQTYQEDAGTYTPPVTNMSYARYQQHLADLAQGATRDETTGMAYINGQPVRA